MNKSNTTRYIELLNPIRETQEIFNNKWKLQIVVTLLAGNTRFNEIGRSLPKISSKILIKELRELEASAIVKRTVSNKNLNINYSIESNNRELRQIIAAYRNFSIAFANRIITGQPS